MVLEYHGQFGPYWTDQLGLFSSAANNPFYLSISCAKVNSSRV